MIHGALAAAVTPLRDGGTHLDEDAFGPVADFLAAGGLDGILALGTTGEGILLTVEERRRAAELYLEACRGRLEVAVHCGAQTTAETVALAEHAASAGASAVAVIPPPYFPLSEESLFEHFRAAAEACAPVPFFLYEFEARSGYAIPQPVIERLREAAPNLAGLKVSDTPFERVQPYLLEGLDIFIGSEPLLPRGLAEGAAGTVSGLAAAFPEYVADLNRDPGANGAVDIGRGAPRRAAAISVQRGGEGRARVARRAGQGRRARAAASSRCLRARVARGAPRRADGLVPGIEVVGLFGGVAELLDDDVALASLHDALDARVLVSGEDEEPRRRAPNRLVLADRDRDRLFALLTAALAEELGAALDLEGLVELCDPLVDLAEKRFVSALSLCACGHDPICEETQANTVEKHLLEA